MIAAHTLERHLKRTRESREWMEHDLKCAVQRATQLRMGIAQCRVDEADLSEALRRLREPNPETGEWEEQR